MPTTDPTPTDTAMTVADMARTVDAQLPSYEHIYSQGVVLLAVNRRSDGNVDMTMLGTGGDPYQVLKEALGHALETGEQPTADAAALVCSGTMTQLDNTTGADTDNRYEVRLVVVVDDTGVAVTVRRKDDGERMHFDEAGEGAMPELLRLWWNGWRALTPRPC